MVQYVNRELHGIEDFEVFDVARKNKNNILLQGPTGSAKTLVAKEYAAQRGIPFTKVSCSVSVNPTELFGRFVPNGQGGFVWQDGSVTQALRQGEGVLLLDEVNMMHPKIAASMFPLLDSNRSVILMDKDSEIITAGEGLLIIGTMNPNYAGTMKPNYAFVNRFPLIFYWDYDAAVEKQLVKSPTLLKLVNNWRQQKGNLTISSPLSTNMMMEFEFNVQHLNIDLAINSFIQHIAQENERSGMLGAFAVSKKAIEEEIKAFSDADSEGSQQVVKRAKKRVRKLNNTWAG